MTRKDAAIIVGNIPIDKGDDCYTIAEYQQAKAMAIRELNQVEVLDKIKAEIEQNAYPIVHGVNSHEKGMTLYGILQIIDKYRGESEK